MSFLQFFGYYIISFLLLQFLLLGIYYIRTNNKQRKFKKFVKQLEKEGKLQFITLDEDVITAASLALLSIVALWLASTFLEY